MQRNGKGKVCEVGGEEHVVRVDNKKAYQEGA